MNIYKRQLLFFIFFLVSIIFIRAQKSEDSTVILQLLKGDTVIYKLFQNEADHLTGFKKKKNNDIWTFKIYPKNELVYYRLKNKEKIWIYEQNISNGNFLAFNEMDNFIQGKKNAKYHYKPIGHFAGGIILGLGLSFFDTYKSGSGILSDAIGTLSLTTPLLSTIILRTKKHNVVSLSSMTKDEILQSHYKKGYYSGKKIKNSFASFTGSLMGVIFVFILNNY
jgi:hypothetical protein